MKNIVKLSLLLSLAIAVFFGNAHASQKQNESLHSLVENFRQAILNKDKGAFNDLFYTEKPPFIAVFGKEYLASKRKKRADYPSTVDFSAYGVAADNLISESVDIDEVISDVEIIADDEIGVVYFNYIDVRDGISKAKGTEAWSVVKHEGAWKIVSVIFSVNDIEHDS